MAFIIFEMYRRVEIEHPIFFILFVNLLVTEISLMVDFTIMLGFPEEKIPQLVTFNNYLCLQFHTVSWMVVAVQR